MLHPRCSCVSIVWLFIIGLAVNRRLLAVFAQKLKNVLAKETANGRLSKEQTQHAMGEAFIEYTSLQPFGYRDEALLVTVCNVAPGGGEFPRVTGPSMLCVCEAYATHVGGTRLWQLVRTSIIASTACCTDRRKCRSGSTTSRLPWPRASDERPHKGAVLHFLYRHLGPIARDCVR